ncbi:MAG TPA: heparinase II/III family protein [Actinopolymorphaceae bacterium]
MDEARRPRRHPERAAADWTYGAYAPERRDVLGRYETSAHEQARAIPGHPTPWTAEDVAAELHRRARTYLSARQITVHYYRIGHTLAFPLPLEERPREFPPVVVAHRSPYPWLIWLGWELEERWRVFAAASRLLDGDVRRECERTLAAELAALARWEGYDADQGGAGLVTAALASAVADVVGHRPLHGAATYDTALAAGRRMVERSFLPWFDAEGGFGRGAQSGGLRHHDLHNIRLITLFRGAQLASAIGHARRESLDSSARELFRTWVSQRTTDPPLTEGAAYDGFLLDSLTEWLDASPERVGLRTDATETLQALPATWANLTLPGRPDLLAPLGDVEGEMPFWTSAAIRIARWFPDPAAQGWLRRLPLPRLPGGALEHAARLADTYGTATSHDDGTGQGSIGEPGSEGFAVGPHRQPATVTLRTGPGEADDVLVAVAAGRTAMGHLHHDGGHVVLGWNGRFWITDPGYQQYLEGAEQDYTLGHDAHNAPVVGGTPQTQRAVNVVEAPYGRDSFRFDLTDCYRTLPRGVTVVRDVRLDSALGAVVVRDAITGSPPDLPIATHWLAGSGLAWAFPDGHVRLGDGVRALWIATATTDVVDESPTRIERLGPHHVRRHPGSRGPIHLVHTATTASPRTVRWWVFLTDPDGSWTPPRERFAAALERFTSSTAA